MVMTDWFGGTDPVQQVWAGNDLLEPGTMDQYNKVLEGVKNGSISMADLDRNVKNILNLALRTPPLPQRTLSPTSLISRRMPR